MRGDTQRLDYSSYYIQGRNEVLLGIMDEYLEFKDWKRKWKVLSRVGGSWRQKMAATMYRRIEGLGRVGRE